MFMPKNILRRGAQHGVSLFSKPERRLFSFLIFFKDSCSLVICRCLAVDFRIGPSNGFRAHWHS